MGEATPSNRRSHDRRDPARTVRPALDIELSPRSDDGAQSARAHIRRVRYVAAAIAGLALAVAVASCGGSNSAAVSTAISSLAGRTTATETTTEAVTTTTPSLTETTTEAPATTVTGTTTTAVTVTTPPTTVTTTQVRTATTVPDDDRSDHRRRSCAGDHDDRADDDHHRAQSRCSSRRRRGGRVQQRREHERDALGLDRVRDPGRRSRRGRCCLVGSPPAETVTRVSRRHTRSRRERTDG